MEVRDAVRAAKAYVMELYEDENLSDVGLEEVEYVDRDGTWNVTIGFSRPWDHRVRGMAAITQSSAVPRSYKVVKLDESGKVLSLSNRDMRASS